MRDDLETIAEKFESSNKLEEQANCLRLALFFNHLDQTLETSLDNCLKANGADPSDMTLRHSIEEQLEELGDLRLASIELRAICKREHTLTNQLKLCEMLADSGSDREALYLLQRLLKGDWHDRNKLTEARCHLALAKLFSKYSRTYNDRGAHASSISIFENALIESRIAVILNPRNKEAQKLFIELSKKAVELASDEASNHFLLAAAYLISGDSSKANSQYAICRALEPSDERLAQAKVVMEIISRDGSSLLNGKIGNSISKVQDMLDADPENAQLWKFLGRLFDQSADSERAQACYKRANNIFYGIYEPVVAR